MTWDSWDEASQEAQNDTLRFLMRFVLLANSEGFDKLCKPLPPPGLKPGRTSGKAREIHARLYERWGKRFEVAAPKLAEHERQSPLRHYVHWFFRNQPYGQGRALRRIVWVHPFWRGKNLDLDEQA